MTIRRLTSRPGTMGRIACTKVLPLVLSALAVAGCKHDQESAQVAGWTLIDPTQRHPIMVSQQPANLNISVARGSQGLTPAQRAEVMDFTSRYRAGDAGNSRLIISAPSGTANESASMAAVQDIHALLSEGGFSESSIAVEAYNGDGSGAPPVRISYMRYVAEGPTCGANWSENLAKTSKNLPALNHGCATQHNLAAMIANPADLLGPRTEGPRYSERRDAVMAKWTKGEVTHAQKSEDEKVRVKGAE
jgi:pilus assembly protein CpaD